MTGTLGEGEAGRLWDLTKTGGRGTRSGRGMRGTAWNCPPARPAPMAGRHLSSWPLPSLGATPQVGTNGPVSTQKRTWVPVTSAPARSGQRGRS